MLQVRRIFEMLFLLLSYPRDIWTLVSLIRLQLPTKLQRLELSLLQCLHHKVYDLKLYCLKQGCANLRKQWTCMRCRVNERKSEVRPKLQKKTSYRQPSYVARPFDIHTLQNINEPTH